MKAASLLLAAVMLAPFIPCLGQEAANSTTRSPCAPPPGTRASYSRCSLWLERGQLWRGREILEGEDDLKPVALSRYVVGDSALAHARSYERNIRTSLWLKFGGGFVMFTGSILLLSKRCPDVPGGCPHTMSWRADMVAGGMGLMGLSFPFRWRGEWEGTKALAWHNGQLSRQE